MTRRRAAWVAAVVAVLLGATYLLTRRSRPVELPVVPARPEPLPTPAQVEPEPVAPVPETEPVVEPVVEPADEPAPTATLPVEQRVPQSWDGGRVVPARPAPPAPAVEPSGQAAEESEEPLPTWVRLSIVAAALLAFFAVSLIATKQV
jgi:hypothetical protein